VYSQDREETLQKEINEQALKEIKLIKSQIKCFHLKTSYFNKRNFHMEVIQILNKLQICFRENQLKNRFIHEMQITDYKEVCLVREAHQVVEIFLKLIGVLLEVEDLEHNRT